MVVDLDEGEVSRAMASGMSREEAEAWELTGMLATALFKLPVLHNCDNGELVSLIHAIQDKLLARPTYRNYLAKGIA